MSDSVKRVGDFEIVRELGAGGMGLVYLARQSKVGREVALKELVFGARGNPTFAQRFLEEARIGGSLSHPNVVVVHDYFEAEGAAYIAMEYLVRGALTPLMKGARLPQAGLVLRDVLAGLAHAASRGIVHRDLKPDNLLVTDDGGVKIADFGIAKAYDRTAVLSLTGQVLGTPAYMAPEQASSALATPATDLYSTGVIAYELLTGRLPFDRSLAPMALMTMHVTQPPPDPCRVNPDLDPRLGRWLTRMLAKAPGDRPPSAAHAWRDLEEVLVDLEGWRWHEHGSLLETSAPDDIDRIDDTPAGTHSPRGFKTYVPPPPLRQEDVDAAAALVAQTEADAVAAAPPSTASDADPLAFTLPPRPEPPRDGVGTVGSMREGPTRERHRRRWVLALPGLVLASGVTAALLALTDPDPPRDASAERTRTPTPSPTATVAGTALIDCPAGVGPGEVRVSCSEIRTAFREQLGLNLRIVEKGGYLNLLPRDGDQPGNFQIIVSNQEPARAGEDPARARARALLDMQILLRNIQADLTSGSSRIAHKQQSNGTWTALKRYAANVLLVHATSAKGGTENSDFRQIDAVLSSVTARANQRLTD